MSGQASYRIVAADGEVVFSHYPTREDAHHFRLEWDKNHPERSPHRVQRLVTTWEDVPEPEPIPELPEKVWAFPRANGDCFLHTGPLPLHGRQFEGTVSAWSEVES